MGLHFVPIKRECVEPVVHAELSLSLSLSSFSLFLSLFLFRTLAINATRSEPREPSDSSFRTCIVPRFLAAMVETWLPAVMVFPRVRAARSLARNKDRCIYLSCHPPAYLSLYLFIYLYLSSSICRSAREYPFIYPRSLVHLRLSARFDAPFRRYLRAATFRPISCAH